MEYILSLIDWPLVVVFAVCGVCFSAVAGEYFSRTKSAGLAILIWPILLALLEADIVSAKIAELQMPEIGVSVALIIGAISIGAMLANTVVFILSEELQNRKEIGAQKKNDCDETTVMSPEEIEAAKAAEKIRAREFWQGFIKEAIQAEPGHYIVDETGHFEKQP